MDIFADIASQGITFSKGLIEHKPQAYSLQVLPLEDGGQRLFAPQEKIYDEKSLYAALDAKRREMAPFMENHAPEQESLRVRDYIREMDFRLETEDDRKDFSLVQNGAGEWKNVSIPHYTGPIGKISAFYRFERNIGEVDRELFICFKAADYIAKVYVNGRMVVEHEGLFAPFEARITDYVVPGVNTFVVEIENDFQHIRGGEKIYAATGPGWDEPGTGWHNNPCGFGLYQDVYLEWREDLIIENVSLLTHEDLKTNTMVVDLMAAKAMHRAVTVRYSVYEGNFGTGKRVLDGVYAPHTWLVCGMGDSLTEAKRKADGSLEHSWPLFVGTSRNTFTFDIEMPVDHLWDNDHPYLYSVQVELVDETGKVLDRFERMSGVRFFSMDNDGPRKGMYRLNGHKIKYRGSNTMGFEQQDVIQGKLDQLRDDILLAKLCNLNFFRLTQRPVQTEIYDYCSMLGIMVQTDLPLFGQIRTTKVAEAIKESEEMERLIRPYPCCTVATFINEPFPNAANEPHRNISRDQLQGFFKAASYIMHTLNPYRVIKPIDGDYNPPEELGLPDNHCYPSWYNGHGIDLGKLHKGYWLPTKPGWFVGCGEFGCEGLDSLDVMLARYPSEWLPSRDPDEVNSTWTPSAIPQSQVGKFHYFFFKTPETLRGWVDASQKYQGEATAIMTRAFRRNPIMSTFAIHLFIDNFPAGWMKTIMDTFRKPKDAYFEYMKALKPVMVDIRTDRRTGRSGEVIPFEIYACNDLDKPLDDEVLYQVYVDNRVVASGKSPVHVDGVDVNQAGVLMFKLPSVERRTKMRVEANLGSSYHSVEFEIFPETGPCEKSVCCSDASFISSAGLQCSSDAETVYLTSFEEFERRETELMTFAENGGRVVISDMPVGKHNIFGKEFEVRPCPMMSVHYAQVFEQHNLMRGFKDNDFRYWYDSSVDYITPFGEKVFLADGVDMMLGGSTAEDDRWFRAYIAGSFKVGKGDVVVSLINLKNRVSGNPVASDYLKALVK